VECRVPDETDDFMAFMNLHDVFLNALLCRRMMLRAPLATDPTDFTISDRGRLERMWITHLYVIVEAWGSPQLDGARRFMAQVTSLEKVDATISSGDADGSIAKMREVRDYMCHRDRREYWDAGRVDVAGQLAYHEELYGAFSEAFLATFDRRQELLRPSGSNGME
jgi:hypothetical protein